MTRRDPPSPIWLAPMRTPKCRWGHPLIDLRERSQVVEYRADGHVLQTCRKCDPPTYAFGIATKYHGLIVFYALTFEQLQFCLTLPVTMETHDILTLLGYANAA